MAKSFYSDSLDAGPDGCLIVHPVLPVRSGVSSPGNSFTRSLDETLAEIEGLSQAISLDVLEVKIAKTSKIHPGHFLGKGVREDIASLVQALEPTVVIFNYALSPVQQRNLERVWNTKVIDRTGLILEIFGERAQTKEGKLQVDLAALEYQKSRLVRSWTHLERQRGGAGFMGGPGETQIEIDRRLIGERIVKLRKELEDVRRTRDLGRKSRERVPYPVVSLVGYTNAGKSTLFNTMTSSHVFAKDLLFATLDPTMRKLKLPGGRDVILSDTVGFISDLPTHLIEAFRATLEQIMYADVIVHVMDCSRPDYEAQRQDVIQILDDMGVEYESDPRIIEVMNKADQLGEEQFAEFNRKAKFDDRLCLVSATQNLGIEQFMEAICGVVARGYVQHSVTLPASDGKSLAWLYRNAEIMQRADEGEAIRLDIQIAPDKLAQFEKMSG